MKLIALRIANYRTIASAQVLPMHNRATIVGPNNSGKTNLLRAVELLFTGADNRLGYSRERDLTFGAGTAKTSLIGTFDGDPHGADSQIYEGLDHLHEQLGTTREGSTFTLNVQFSASGNPIYQFFPNMKKPKGGTAQAQYSQTKTGLVRQLLGSFAVHYVPSAKSIDELYGDLLMPFMRGLAAEALSSYLPDLQNALDGVAEEINSELDRVGLSELEASFSIPDDSAENLFTSFDLHIADPAKTIVFNKGQGIQSTSLLASLLWITREERSRGLNTLWLLEEPESYLHPELARACVSLLNELQSESQVVVTTHSLAFVPQNPASIVGCRTADARTELETFSTFTSATSRIREALGVRFSDFYSLGEYNLLLEGESDRHLIKWALQTISAAGLGHWETLEQAELLDYGGVSQLEGFLRATYYLIRKERPTVAVFDGDHAGVKSRKALQSFFGKKNIPFEPNKDFVSVRNHFAIEGLFPDEWIVEIHEQNKNWFDTFSLDSSGELEPYRIRSHNKSSVQAELVTRAEASSSNDDWTERWLKFLDACEAALLFQEERLRQTS